MAGLRFHQRHALQTILDMLQTELVTLGWGNSALAPTDPINAAVNFGTTPITYQKALPDLMGKTDVAANTVAVTVGDASADAPYELGASLGDANSLYGLHQVQIPVFIDVFGEQDQIAESIAEDIKPLFARAHRFLTVKDYTADSAGVETDELIEFDDVMGPIVPAAAGTTPGFHRHWRVVKAMANLQFNPAA